jgi:hypothetical protein
MIIFCQRTHKVAQREIERLKATNECAVSVLSLGLGGLNSSKNRDVSVSSLGGLNKINRSSTFFASLRELNRIKKSVEPELPRHDGSNDINTSTMCEPFGYHE